MLVQKLSWITVLLVLCQHGVEAKRIIACQGKIAVLQCDEGGIHIINANYGRTDAKTCMSNLMIDTSCFQISSHYIMSIRCDGTSRCAVPAGNAVFGDPCPDSYKYLDVSYECQ
ncbi:L-rhamnose-binding lectin CSL3-like [Chanodichthys erythropterus]|uniref:L-rhamnose-binding lectin CSL3-like n=1 Tax=Chanodichthys erythropterus TaxID=933992 RepID=UPI00351EEB7E